MCDARWLLCHAEDERGPVVRHCILLCFPTVLPNQSTTATQNAHKTLFVQQLKKQMCYLKDYMARQRLGHRECVGRPSETFRRDNYGRREWPISQLTNYDVMVIQRNDSDVLYTCTRHGLHGTL